METLGACPSVCGTQEYFADNNQQCCQFEDVDIGIINTVTSATAECPQFSKCGDVTFNLETVAACCNGELIENVTECPATTVEPEVTTVHIRLGDDYGS